MAEAPTNVIHTFDDILVNNLPQPVVVKGLHTWPYLYTLIQDELVRCASKNCYLEMYSEVPGDTYYNTSTYDIIRDLLKGTDIFLEVLSSRELLLNTNKFEYKNDTKVKKTLYKLQWDIKSYLTFRDIKIPEFMQKVKDFSSKFIAIKDQVSEYPLFLEGYIPKGNDEKIAVANKLRFQGLCNILDKLEYLYKDIYIPFVNSITEQCIRYKIEGTGVAIEDLAHIDPINRDSSVHFMQVYLEHEDYTCKDIDTTRLDVVTSTTNYLTNLSTIDSIDTYVSSMKSILSYYTSSIDTVVKLYTYLKKHISKYLVSDLSGYEAFEPTDTKLRLKLTKLNNWIDTQEVSYLNTLDTDRLLLYLEYLNIAIPTIVKYNSPIPSTILNYTSIRTSRKPLRQGCKLLLDRLSIDTLPSMERYEFKNFYTNIIGSIEEEIEDTTYKSNRVTSILSTLIDVPTDSTIDIATLSSIYELSKYVTTTIVDRSTIGVNVYNKLFMNFEKVFHKNYELSKDNLSSILDNVISSSLQELPKRYIKNTSTKYYLISDIVDKLSSMNNLTSLSSSILSSIQDTTIHKKLFKPLCIDSNLYSNIMFVPSSLYSYYKYSVDALELILYYELEHVYKLDAPSELVGVYKSSKGTSSILISKLKEDSSIYKYALTLDKTIDARAMEKFGYNTTLEALTISKGIVTDTLGHTHPVSKRLLDRIVKLKYMKN